MTGQYTKPAIAERGGAGVGPASMGKNYMQYTLGGSYDDDQYNLYASANYGSDGTGSMDSNSRAPPSLAINDPSRPQMDETKESRKGFQVMNQDALNPETKSINQVANYYTCPACNTLATKTCGCQYRDAGCANGHLWFWADGKKQPGISPNHKEPVRTVFNK